MGRICPLWVEVTEIHFFQHLLFSVCLLKCPLGEPTNLMRVTLTHQLQRNCLFVSFRFSVHIIQFHVHVIIPFIHNQSPSVAFHSTHRQLSLRPCWRCSWVFICWWKGLPRRIDLPSDRREVAEKEHHLDSLQRSISSLVWRTRRHNLYTYTNLPHMWLTQEEEEKV